VVLYTADGTWCLVDGKDNLPTDIDRSKISKYRLYINDAPQRITEIPEGHTFLYMHRVIGMLNQPAPPDRYLRIGYIEKDTDTENGDISEIKVANE
jgi:hypothetical protein